MASEQGQSPREEGLRRRAAQLDERESRLCRWERDLAARESELEYGAVDRRLHAVFLADERRGLCARALAATRRAAPAAVALWLLTFPLTFPAQRGALHTSAVIAGAAVAFLALAGARAQRLRMPEEWGFGLIGTWVLAWAGLGDATTAAGWALAATGAMLWVMALAPQSSRARPSGASGGPHDASALR
jgi:hypothetical protein